MIKSAMKIAMISKADSSGGGASRVATELTDALASTGIEVLHWIARQSGPTNHPVRQLHGESPLIRLAVRSGVFLLRRLGAPDLLPCERLNPALRDILNADLIHAHDISTAMAIDTLGWLARHRPLVWTLHDCSAFTGGCINPLSCQRFRHVCGHCPEQGSWPLDGMLDLSGMLLAQRRRVARKTRLKTIAPSWWMADLATSTGLFGETGVISNAIDLDVFRPIDKRYARDCLRVPSDRPVFAIAAASLHDPRKGIADALRAVHRVHGNRPTLLVIGKASPDLTGTLPDVDVRFSGFIEDRGLLATWYSAADLLLYPSTADNQPLTVMESMACGTPVFGFATGGIPEIVDHKENGLLVETGDVAALSQALVDVLNFAVPLEEWSRAATARAQNFSWSRAVSAHLDLYRLLTL